MEILVVSNNYPSYPEMKQESDYQLLCCFELFSDIAVFVLKRDVKLQLTVVLNHATGYARHHIWCLSKARINWEGCSSKGIWRKNGG